MKKTLYIAVPFTALALFAATAAAVPNIRDTAIKAALDSRSKAASHYLWVGGGGELEQDKKNPGQVRPGSINDEGFTTWGGE